MKVCCDRALKRKREIDCSRRARIGLADLGLLASAGKSKVLVSRRPRVAIIATGDELVDVSETPQARPDPQQQQLTRFTRRPKLPAPRQLCSVSLATISKIFVQRSASGFEHDILLVSGGVSMGKYDLVENVFAEFGVKVLFDKIAMKPGKPTVFGYRDRTYVFGLPGNPVSTMVAFHMFVRPLILFLLKAEDTNPKILEAKLEAPAKCDPERAALVPAMVRFESGHYRIQTAPWKGSSDLVGLSRANALIVIPQREGTMEPGETAQFLPME